jgi:hypothetical protein
MRMFLIAAIAGGISVVGLAATATAQPASVQAEQLFRQGKKLMSEGKIAEACKAFDGSYRKEETVSTLLNLADCREKNKQYASAWGYFLDAERKTRGDAAQATFNRTARERAMALETKLSYFIINVTKEASIEGLVITRNGLPVDEAEWNSDIPVDGGEYKIEGKAPGYEAWSTTITIGAERDKQSVNVPKFRERPKAVGESDQTANDQERVVPTVDSAPASSRRKTIVIATVATGGVLVIGGLATGYLAQQKWSEAKTLCGDDLVCDSAADRMAGDDLVDAARLRGNISTVVTGVGIAVLATGAVLWLTAPRAERKAASVTVVPTLTSNAVGVAIGGAL